MIYPYVGVFVPVLFPLLPIHTMPPLELLKKSLSILHESVKKRKDGLIARQNRKEKLSDAKEAWLDNEANHVDEDALIDRLEKASDYEHSFARLNEKEVGLVNKLKQVAEGAGKSVATTSNKPKKCVFFTV